MSEKILKIEEFDNLGIQKENKYHPGYFSEDFYEGYIITTEKQVIQVLIDNGAYCCEQFGSVCSNDNFEDFIGAELNSVYVSDVNLMNHEVLNDLYEGDAIFVNLETSQGKLQFAVYNCHNGYYGHQVLVQINNKVQEYSV